MQHRFAMPTLEVEEFPQVLGNNESTDMLLQEILSVAHASQQLINHSQYSHYSHSWPTTPNQHYYASASASAQQDDQHDYFTFMVNHHDDTVDYYNQYASWEDPNPNPINTIRSIQIGDLDDHDDFKSDHRMVENLRWVGMSTKDLEIQSFMEDQKIVPIEEISSCFHTNRELGKKQLVQAECDSRKEMNESEINDMSLGFMNKNNNDEKLIDEDDYSRCPSFEVVEEVKVSHGMFVSTRQVADTFFHQIVPSQTLKVHLNPVITVQPHYSHYIDHINADHHRTLSFFRDLKAHLKPIASALIIVFLFPLLMMLSVHYSSQHVQDIKRMKEYSGGDHAQFIEWNNNNNNNEKEKVWLVGIQSGKGFMSVVFKKIAIFLTISFALSTMWANHIILH